MNSKTATISRPKVQFKAEQQRSVRPLLKWAGGKQQLLSELTAKTPEKYGKYIEPFFGGGALYFHLLPENAVIADSNPELINMYRSVAKEPEKVLAYLRKFENTKDFFLKIRREDWKKLSSARAAARTIFLNKTCFNGLYRVNRKGGFNVPFGNYKNPNFVNERVILEASRALRRATIVEGDYKKVLRQYAQKGDYIFLDPPYLPISKYSDFKRYTKEQFYDEDHRELAEEVRRLHALGCNVVLTNSNHPLVHELYEGFDIEIVQTNRYINSKASKRKGEDVIVTARSSSKLNLTEIAILSSQTAKFPPTRYMGSKNKLLNSIWSITSQFNVETVLDLFSGSGVVSYMMKAQGKRVIANDYMQMASVNSRALVENNSERLSDFDIAKLLMSVENDHFVERTFKGLYFTDEENRFIDKVRTNIKLIRNKHKKAMAMAALIRMCTKKRPRGIFTYVGDRYNDGRQDLTLSAEQQFLNAVALINDAVFDNGKQNISLWGDALSVTKKADLVYIDPPYFSPLSDNEYVRRYHFVEGLARDWKGVEIQDHTLTKKFKSYPTPFSSQKGAADAFAKLFSRHRESVLLVSYSSNSLPTLDEMVEILGRYKQKVEVLLIDHKYSFGNKNGKTSKNAVKEYLFVGY